MYTISPEEISFQLGLSKMDLRKVLKSSLSGIQVDKHIGAMYKKLQKSLTSEELLPSLWDKCKKEFLDKYDSFAQLLAKIYPSETIPSVTEMRDLQKERNQRGCDSGDLGIWFLLFHSNTYFQCFIWVHSLIRNQSD